MPKSSGSSASAGSTDASVRLSSSSPRAIERADGGDRHRQQNEIEGQPRLSGGLRGRGGQRDRDWNPAPHGAVVRRCSWRSFQVRVSVGRGPLAPSTGTPSGRARAAAGPPAGGRPLGAPPVPFLARPDHGARQPRARLPRRRGGPSPGRRAPLPRLARVHDERRLPRAPRAGHARRAAGGRQRGLRRRDSGRAPARGRVRSRLGASTSPPSARPRSCDGRRCSEERCSRCWPAWAAYSLAGLPPLDRALSATEAHGPLYTLAGRRSPAVRVRSGSLPPPLPAAAGGHAACHRHCLHLAGGGDGRDRPRPQLACVLVGVARADGVRLRNRRLHRAERVPPPPLDRAPSSRISTSSTPPTSSIGVMRAR